jgi:hypothetical protein
MSIDKGYYADKEDAYKMKKFFKQEDREKEKSKIVELKFDVKFDDIKNAFEEVDMNGEEKSLYEEEKQEDKEKESDENKKKKKKNKKK